MFKSFKVIGVFQVLRIAGHPEVSHYFVCNFLEQHVSKVSWALIAVDVFSLIQEYVCDKEGWDSRVCEEKGWLQGVWPPLLSVHGHAFLRGTADKIDAQLSRSVLLFQLSSKSLGRSLFTSTSVLFNVTTTILSLSTDALHFFLASFHCGHLGSVLLSPFSSPVLDVFFFHIRSDEEVQRN